MHEPHALLRATGTPEAGSPRIDRGVIASIRSAAKATGVDFGYLMAQAGQESSFKPAARAAGSSASGLYQFIDSTWLQMMHEYGAKYGMGDLAAAVKPTAQGTLAVADPAQRRRILALRNDPNVAAAFGAEYASSNQAHLEQALGRTTNATDLYMAHFLGPGGAGAFLKAMRDNPRQPAADLLPQAAAANQSVFYDQKGAPRSLRDIYDRFQAKIGSKVQTYAALANEAGGSGAAAFPAVASNSLRTAFDGGGIMAAAALERAVGPITGYQPHARPMLSLSSVAALSVYETLGQLKAPSMHDSRPPREIEDAARKTTA